MEKNVLDFEPGEALFVPDDDPIRFYKAILRHSQYLLNNMGKIYFEINEAFGIEVSGLCKDSGCAARIVKDINDKDRFVHARKFS